MADRRHGPGRVVRPDSDRPRARRRWKRDFRGCRAHDPFGPVSAIGSSASARSFLPGGAHRSGGGIKRGGRIRSCDRRGRRHSWRGCALDYCWLFVALVLPDPVRGSSEGVDIQRLRLHERVGPSREDYIDMMVNSSYTYSVFGITFSSFALAGLVYWSPTFLTVAKGLTEARGRCLACS